MQWKLTKKYQRTTEADQHREKEFMKKKKKSHHFGAITIVTLNGFRRPIHIYVYT